MASKPRSRAASAASKIRRPEKPSPRKSIRGRWTPSSRGDPSSEGVNSPGQPQGLPDQLPVVPVGELLLGVLGADPAQLVDLVMGPEAPLELTQGSLEPSLPGLQLPLRQGPVHVLGTVDHGELRPAVVGAANQDPPGRRNLGLEARIGDVA